MSSPDSRGYWGARMSVLMAPTALPVLSPATTLGELAEIATSEVRTRTCFNGMDIVILLLRERPRNIRGRSASWECGL